MIPAGARVKAKVRAEREKPIVHHLSNSTQLITLLQANLLLALYWSKVTVQLARLYLRWNLQYHRAPGFSTHRLQDRKKKSSQSNHDCTIWTRRHSQISPVSMTLWRETICIMKSTVRSPLCRNSPKTKRPFQSLSLRLRRSSCLVSWNKQAPLRSMIKSRKGQFKCQLYSNRNSTRRNLHKTWPSISHQHHQSKNRWGRTTLLFRTQSIGIAREFSIESHSCKSSLTWQTSHASAFSWILSTRRILPLRPSSASLSCFIKYKSYSSLSKPCSKSLRVRSNPSKGRLNSLQYKCKRSRQWELNKVSCGMRLSRRIDVAKKRIRSIVSWWMEQRRKWTSFRPKSICSSTMWRSGSSRITDWKRSFASSWTKASKQMFRHRERRAR